MTLSSETPRNLPEFFEEILNLLQDAENLDGETFSLDFSIKNGKILFRHVSGGTFSAGGGTLDENLEEIFVSPKELIEEDHPEFFEV